MCLQIKVVICNVISTWNIVTNGLTYLKVKIGKKLLMYIIKETFNY